MITAQRWFAGGASGIRTRSGLDAGGRLRTIARLPVPEVTTGGLKPGPRVARQPPGARVERLSGARAQPDQVAARPGRVGPA